jgi:hypothetical protein
MTHYADLTPYVYAKSRVPGGVNIGWLSSEEPYPVDQVPDGLVDALAQLAAAPKNLYRGYHLCELCISAEEAARSKKKGNLFLGNGEIHVPVPEGAVYVAPTLVVHYVEAHRYIPPQDFISAALHTAATLNGS